MRLIIFLVCFFGIIFFSSTLQENYQGILANVLSIAFVFGGTLIATMISFPVKKIRNLRSVIKNAFLSGQYSYAEHTRLAISAARQYKRSGFKALEQAARETVNPYFKLGFQLIADNCTWEEMKSSIEKEFIFDTMQVDSAERIVRTMARYAPSFGLAGTILGLMRIFPQLSNPVNIGGAMSLALLTTLYGVLAANLLFLPLSSKLKDKISDDEHIYRFITEALRCVYDREYSIVIEQRLSVLMPKTELVKYHGSRTDTHHLKIAENA